MMDSNENSGDFFLDSGLDDYCEYLRNDLFDEDFNFWDELTDDFIGGIIATVLIVLLLIFGGEFMCSLFFGSWQHLIDFESSAMIWFLCFFLAIFLLPTLVIFFILACIPAFLACLTYPLFDNWIVTAVAVLIAGFFSGPVISIALRFARKTVYHFWQMIAYFFVRKSSDIERARKILAKTILWVALLVMPLALFAGNWYFDSKDPFEVMGEITSKDRVNVDISGASGLDKIGNDAAEKVEEKIEEKIEEEAKEALREHIIHSIMNN